MTTLTPEELSAILSALEGLDAEYGLYIGAPPTPLYRQDLPAEQLALHRAAVTAAAEAGQALIKKIKALAEAGQPVNLGPSPYAARPGETEAERMARIDTEAVFGPECDCHCGGAEGDCLEQK